MTFNWDYLITVWPDYWQAMQITAALSGMAIVLSLLLGLPLALALLRHSKFARAYVAVSRNTPLLIQLFFLYFGLPKIGIPLSGYTCAIIGLTFTGSAVMAEAFRGGLEAVQRGQHEAGLAIGLSPKQIFRHIELPQALAVSIPALGANALFLVKETSIVATLGIAELVFTTKDLIGLDYKTAEALFMLLVGYLLLLTPVVIFLTWLEKRLRWATYGY